MKSIAKAIIAVMQEVEGIDKTMTVGSGSSSYKGVPDQEVKEIIGEAMAKNGLCILPIGVQTKTEVSRWEETTTYNNVPQTKQKQSVFTEVTTKYLLLHESGESIELSGYGHGVDAQDKGAGKATTYALKYALLYTFLVPTGKIDDSDSTHSDEIAAPKVVKEIPTDQKVQQMVKKVQPLSIDELAVIQDSLKLITTIDEFKTYFKSLTDDVKKDKGALELFTARHEELKQPA